MRRMEYRSLYDAPFRIEIDELGHHVVFKRISDGLLFVRLDERGCLALVVEENVPSITVHKSDEHGPIIERNKMVDVMYLLSNQTNDALINFALRLHGHDVPIEKHSYTLPSWYEIR